MTMTPDRQTKYAPEHGMGRQGLAYDRLRTEWQAAGRAVPGATWGGIRQPPQRSTPEAREALLESFRRLNGTVAGGSWRVELVLRTPLVFDIAATVQCVLDWTWV